VNPVLDVHHLSMAYRTRRGPLQALDDISLSLAKGESLGLVGESGCGKSSLVRTILRLLPPSAEITSGRIDFDGDDLATLAEPRMRRIRQERIALVTQSAMNALDPVYRIGDQIVETIRIHRKVTRAQAGHRAAELFDLVGLDPSRLASYPHQLSGGMKQRCIIAIALALDPDIVIADEPTTALDVIVQDRILRKMRSLQRERGDSMIYVSHDISVIAETCDTVAVMYAGEIVETADVHSFFDDAHHPYTMGLQNAFPHIDEVDTELISIPGHPPDLLSPPRGCRFAPRCPFVQEICVEVRPRLVTVDHGHAAACHFTDRAAEFRDAARRPETWSAVAERLLRGGTGDAVTE
jgi:oligopeptide/dipeptide ABC transporter ATP-binding protein